MALWIALVLVLSGMLAAPALALPAYPGIVMSVYGLKSGGKVLAAGCNLCHSGETNKEHLNLYGKEVQSILPQTGIKTLTPELLHSLDNKDSDGDGFSNGQELEADTLPGDSTSKPAGQPKQATSASSK